MKHHVIALSLFICFSLYTSSDRYIVADKSKRIGRFSYEDSFDNDVSDDILKYSPSIIKKNIKKLLYSFEEDGVLQRLLLLGKISNKSITAIAKAIALRCGYEYYVIEASMLREYHVNQQMLLAEVQSVIRQGNPVAIIITGLPEIVDYSGLLASTLCLLLDQCAQYSDVLVIATSGFQEKQLSHEIKKFFEGNIIPVQLNKDVQQRIEAMSAIKNKWIEKYNIAPIIVGGFICCGLAIAYMIKEILYEITNTQKQWTNEKEFLEQKIVDVDNKMKIITEENNQQNQLLQSQLDNMQGELLEYEKELEHQRQLQLEEERRRQQSSYQTSSSQHTTDDDGDDDDKHFGLLGFDLLGMGEDDDDDDDDD